MAIYLSFDIDDRRRGLAVEGVRRIRKRHGSHDDSNRVGD
jgi:hypothetical protein